MIPKFSTRLAAIAIFFFSITEPTQAQSLSEIREDLRELGERFNLLPPDSRDLDLLAPQKRRQVRQLLQTNRCPSCDLTGVNLKRAALAGADLRGAILNAADLRGANLQGADLSNASLIFTRLDKANLQEVNLRGAYISRDGLALVHSIEGATLPYGSVAAESRQP